MFITVRHSWAILGPFRPFLALLCPFWGSFLSPFVPSVMKSPFQKCQHFVHNFDRRGSRDRHLSLLDTLGYFGELLGPSGPFWVLLRPSVMSSPFVKFQHFYVTLVGGVQEITVRLCLTLLCPFGLFLAFWALLSHWALLGPSGMKSLFEKFQHLLPNLWSAGAGHRHSWTLLGSFWPF